MISVGNSAGNSTLDDPGMDLMSKAIEGIHVMDELGNKRNTDSSKFIVNSL